MGKKPFQKVYDAMQEEVNEYLQDAMKKFVDPAKLSEILGGKTPMLDSYKILGLDKGATDEEIRTRHRELSKLLHPDTAQVKGTEFLFNLVQIAYGQITK